MTDACDARYGYRRNPPGAKASRSGEQINGSPACAVVFEGSLPLLVLLESATTRSTLAARIFANS